MAPLYHITVPPELLLYLLPTRLNTARYY